MEKYILTEDKQTANELIIEIESRVLPAVESLIEKLTEIGITSEIKQRIGEIFTGNYQAIRIIHKEALEKDASLFKTPTAKEAILKQHSEVMADFGENSKDIVDKIRYSEVGGMYLNDIAILDFIEFDKKGVPALTKEKKSAIKEHFTTYVETELGAEFHKKHIEVTNALNDLSAFCENVGLKFYLPIQLFTSLFVRGENVNIKPAEIDYDKIVLSKVEENKDDDEVLRGGLTTTMPSKPKLKELHPRTQGRTIMKRN